jgi:8-oxo-dGTP diphosphatase
VARPILQISEPTEAGHSAVWMRARDAGDALDNEGDRAMLMRALAAR